MTTTEAPRSKIYVEVDFDKTASGPSHEGWLGKLEGSPLLKGPNRPIEGAREGIEVFRAQPDFIFGGIATSRRRLIRLQTPHQARKVGVNKNEISYLGHSGDYSTKAKHVLKRTAQYAVNHPTEKVRAVIVEDKARKMEKAALKLARDPYWRRLMIEHNFTLVAYNPKPDTYLEDVRDQDDVVMRVIPMENWQPETVQRVLTQLRGENEAA